MLESYKAKILRVRPDGSVYEWYVGPLTIDEDQGRLNTVWLEPEPEERELLEDACSVFNPEASPLIWDYEHSKDCIRGSFVGGDPHEFPVDLAELLEAPYQVPILDALQRAARRLVQRARLNEPIAVLPDEMSDSHRLFRMTRHGDPFSCDAMRLTSLPDGYLTPAERRRRQRA